MSRRAQRPAEYHRLGIQAKQRLWLMVRAQPVRCSRCDTQLMEVDLEGHAQARCLGSRERRDAALLEARQPPVGWVLPGPPPPCG